MKLFLRSFPSLPLNHSWRVVVSYKRKDVHEVLVNCSLVQACSGKSVVRWTDRPAMTIAVDLGRKATKQTNKVSRRRSVRPSVQYADDNKSGPPPHTHTDRIIWIRACSRYFFISSGSFTYWLFPAWPCEKHTCFMWKIVNYSFWLFWTSANDLY